MKLRTGLKGIALGAIIIGGLIFGSLLGDGGKVGSIVSADSAIANVNGGNEEFVTMNLIQKNKEHIKNAGGSIALLGIIGLMFMMCPTTKKEVTEVTTNTFIIMCMLGIICSAGCIKPYDKPEYEEIKPSETAFLIKLEGTDNQAKFDSADKLAASKVAAKRIQITHRWDQQGRYPNSGKWIPEVMIIKVDRAPITVEWESIAGSKGKDKAIWTESADSVGFSLGWSSSGYIKEENAAKFLYMYPSGSLKNVMDTEIRARIQQISAEVSAKYKLDELRDKKMEIAMAVQTNVIPFFEERGITITTIGMFGGMTYENEKIQDAIDGTFIAQQEKVVAAAILAAQDDKNKKIESEAKAKANAAETEAGVIAKGNLLKAESEAKGIEAVNNAIAKSNPMLLQLKELDVQKIKYEKWSGNYPTTVAGADANLWVGLPSVEKQAVIAK